MDWIKTFKKLLDTSLDPASVAKLKIEYANWVKSRGTYYAGLKNTAPEFLDLLNAIEDSIGVQVKIEAPKKSKETKEGDK